MLTSCTEVQVRYSETDMMGIAYHGNYLPWFEVGRTTLLKEHGFPYLELEKKGFRLPVLSVNVKYKKPAIYDDILTIETTMAEKPTLRISLNYRVLRDEELLATASTQHAFINTDGQPIRPPSAFVQEMDKLFQTNKS
jgi:acyl-CoA thioester hydrolase